MSEYIKRFTEWFAVENPNEPTEWHGLEGWHDASATVFMAPLPSSRWHREQMLGQIVARWADASEPLAEWKAWLLRGIQAGKVDAKFRTYDLSKMVERPNRWKHKDSTGTKRLAPGDVVCPKGTVKRKFVFGFDVAPALHAAEQIFKVKPSLSMPNIPIPAVMVAPDESCALFMFPIVGHLDTMPHLYELSAETSFGDFFGS